MEHKIDFRPFQNALSKKVHRPENPERQGLGNMSDSDEPYFLLDPFVVDKIKLTGSKAYRRLSEKTQVFCAPANPHVRTRLFHTSEVAAVAIQISEILGLNTQLCEAIAIGHDIGHAPYGHFGEEMISELSGKEFRHNVFGLVVASSIERRGGGLSLTKDALEGIVAHSRGAGDLSPLKNSPQEYDVVMFADKIAYTMSDVNDAIRLGYIDCAPKDALFLGETQRQRTARCLYALVKESAEEGLISFSNSKTALCFKNLRKWMFENVYFFLRQRMNIHCEVFKYAYEYLSNEKYFAGHDPGMVIALMTDLELNHLANIFLRNGRPKLFDLNSFGIMEIIPDLPKGIEFNKI